MNAIEHNHQLMCEICYIEFLREEIDDVCDGYNVEDWAEVIMTRMSCIQEEYNFQEAEFFTCDTCQQDIGELPKTANSFAYGDRVICFDCWHNQLDYEPSEKNGKCEICGEDTTCTS